MVIKLTELPQELVAQYEQLIPLFLMGDDLNVEMVAGALGVHRNTARCLIRRMREAGLPIPQIGKQDTHDYGPCPNCGKGLDVGFVDRRKAICYCPACGWDAASRRKTPQWVTTQQAADMLGVGKSTVLRWIVSEQLEVLPRAKTQRRCSYRIPISAIEAIHDNRHN